MTSEKTLAALFEQHRTHLRAAAHRMLGSRAEADDAVQEAWLRLSRSDVSTVENLRGWLTTVVARICLDMLRARRSRREDPHADSADETFTDEDQDAPEPERESLLADSIGVALLVVLETLSPAERVAFVLHDLFAVPFDDIAGIVGRTEGATRQLASRARRRVQGAAPGPDPDRARQRELVGAFLAAARGAQFDKLLAILDPEVVVRADATAQSFGSAPEQRGADAVARTFSGRAAAARQVLIDGVPGLCWAPGGKPKVVIAFSVAGDRVAALDLIADEQRLAALDLVFLD